jgi:hypothetical protein
VTNTLVSPVDLIEFPGSPFTEDVVDSAAGMVRLEAGWHIAPEITETILVDGYGGRDLILPTLRLVTVTEVRDVSGDDPVVMTGWRKSRKGILTRDAGWPCGEETVEIDLVHGYASTPRELLPVIADFARSALSDSRVSQTSLGAFSESYRASLSGTDQGSILTMFSVRTGSA